jgi:hypothetical protein
MFIRRVVGSWSGLFGHIKKMHGVEISSTIIEKVIETFDILKCEFGFCILCM